MLFSNQGQESLKEVLKKTDQILPPIKASSIYSVKGNPNKIEHIHDLRSLNSYSGLCLVLLSECGEAPEKIMTYFQSFESEFKKEAKRRSLSLNLLMYDDLTLMTPEVTLPHPDFHHRPEFVVPAAEIWGDKTHPILEKTINQLAKDFRAVEWGEFYAQSETVLAF